MDFAISAVFKRYDRDNSGALDQSELLGFFNGVFEMIKVPYRVSEKEVWLLLKLLDKNHDGRVGRDELSNMTKKIVSSGGVAGVLGGNTGSQGGFGGNSNNQGGYGNQGGFNQGGYNQGGYNQGGNSGQGGYNQGGFNQGGYNQGGFDQGQGGYNQGGYNQGGQGGYNQGGYGGF